MAAPFTRALVTVAFVLALTGIAGAQVCGDADGNGTVTVTDGVQALRAAAGLSSSCSAAACDVDGSGGVTVTDGVNILRKAAGIPITEGCPGTSTDAQIEQLLRSTLPVFGALVKRGASAGASARAAETFQCENVDGSFTIDEETGEIFFDNCVFADDGFRYDGFFLVSDSTLDFDLTFTDLATGEFESLSGSLSQRPVGQNFVVDGFLDLESTLGVFSVDLENLVVDANANFVGGALEFSVDDAELAEVESIRMTFDGTNIALVEVKLAEGDVLPFNYDLVSEELTEL